MIKNIIILLIFSLPVYAERQLMDQLSDSRLKVVTYDENETYPLSSHFGYFIHIITAPYEIVQKDTIKFGMEGVFYFDSKKNKVIVWPRTKGEATNMTFDTNLRSYYFTFKPPHGKKSKIPKDLTYRLKFDYPGDEIAFAREARLRAELKERKKEKKLAKKGKRKELKTCRAPNLDNVNFEYDAEGSMNLRPTFMFNDDKFTYLLIDGEFSSIKAVGKDNIETIVNYHQDDCGYLVIEAIKPKFVLRRGDEAVCLINNGFKKPKSFIKEKG